MNRSIISAAALTLVALSACASTKTVPAATQSSSDYVTSIEINATAANTAYDLVSRLRPNWLRQGGTSSIGGGRIASQITLVYLDGNKMGGLETLRTINASGIRTMQWLDAARAETVLRGVGTEAISGAILLRTTQ